MRFLCVISLVLLAFAHRPVGLEWNEYDSTQYLLPDGTYPVLCLSDHDSPERHDNQSMHQTGCEACRISSAYLCPEPGSSTWAAGPVAKANAQIPAAPTLKRSIYPPSAPPRAPPIA